MTDGDRHILGLRFMEIEAELSALAESRVVDGDPVAVEAAILAEQDELE